MSGFISNALAYYDRELERVQRALERAEDRHDSYAFDLLYAERERLRFHRSEIALMEVQNVEH